MGLYLVKLVFAVYSNNNDQPGEFDEQIRIVSSGNLEGAFLKARHLGRLHEDSFTTKTNQRITWRFIDVSEMYDLGEVKDGAELYSQTHKTDSADTFIHYIRQKSIEIQVKNLTFA